MRSLLEIEQLDIKDQPGVGRNGADTPAAVCHFRRQNDNPSFTLFHIQEGYIPSGNYLMTADIELERFVPVP